ncbi:MAG TPA: flagellar motor protein MotB [Nitrospiria bacterium]|jgi:chemotaxis protein MotB
MAKKDKGGEEKFDPNAWMNTFADLLTLLLTFFALLFSMKSMDKGKLQEVLGHFREGGISTQELGAGNPVSEPEIIEKFIKVRPPTLSPSQIKKLLYSKGGKRIFQVSTDLRGIVIRLPDSVLFSSGNSKIQSQGYPLLDELTQLLQQIPNQVRIEGHSNSLGTEHPSNNSNWELSLERAVTVLNYLLQKGDLNPERFFIAGYADTRPIVPNNSPQNRARNRRVEMVLLEKQNSFFSRRQ